MSSPSVSRQRIRVALFLILTLGVLIAAVIVLGHSQNLFSRKATLHTSFANAGGLINGSEVRLAGVAVGAVGHIQFFHDGERQRVGVDLSVRATYLEWIRKDSVAQVTSKGLLGDSIVDLTVGSPEQPALVDGDAIPSTEPASLGQIVTGLQSALQRIDGLASDLDARVRLIVTPQVATDFGRVLHSAAEVAEAVDQGPGLAHALIHEPALARDTSQALHELEESAGEIDRSGHDLEQLLAEARKGPGLLHELVYNQDGKNLIRDLSEASRIVRQIAVETEQGKGTIGGLLKDPTIYEDLTTILGNIKRNAILKALIRFTIVKDGLERPGRVKGD